MEYKKKQRRKKKKKTNQNMPLKVCGFLDFVTENARKVPQA